MERLRRTKGQKNVTFYRNKQKKKRKKTKKGEYRRKIIQNVCIAIFLAEQQAKRIRNDASILIFFIYGTVNVTKKRKNREKVRDTRRSPIPEIRCNSKIDRTSRRKKACCWWNTRANRSEIDASNQLRRSKEKQGRRDETWTC